MKRKSLAEMTLAKRRAPSASAALTYQHQARVREAEPKPESLDLFSTEQVGNSPRYKPTAGAFTTMHASVCMHQLKGSLAVYGM